MNAAQIRTQTDDPTVFGGRFAAAATAPVAFATAFAVAFLLSKVLGFFPGYALDDYVTGQQSAVGLSQQFIAQGRFTFALLHDVLSRAHLQQADFASTGLFALALFSALFYCRAFELDGRGPRLGFWVASGLLLGAHPYLAEYVTFRQAIMPLALAMFLSWLSIGSYITWRNDGGLLRLSTAIFAAVLATGTNQLALAFLSIAALYWELQPAAGASGMREAGRQLLVGISRTAAASLTVVIIYYAIATGVKLAAGVTGGDTRATFLALSAVAERAVQVWDLLLRIGFGDEAIASRIAKAGLWLAFFALLVSAGIRQPVRAVVALVFLAIAVSLAVLPVSVGSVWWPVPRTLVAIPMALIGVLALLAHGGHRPLQGIAAIGLGFSALLLAAHSSSMLNDQQRLNRWDVLKARDVASRIAERYPSANKLALSGARWSYPVATDMAQGDMNVSAISVGWAVDALFDEATGEQMTVRTTATPVPACAARPRFPAEDSTFLDGDEVVACL